MTTTTTTLPETDQQKEIRRKIERIDEKLVSLADRQKQASDKLDAAIEPFRDAFRDFDNERQDLASQRTELEDQFYAEQDNQNPIQVGSTVFIGEERVTVKEIWHDYLFVESHEIDGKSGTVNRGNVRRDWTPFSELPERPHMPTAPRAIDDESVPF